MSEYRFRVSLFYSYCHADESYRERMETALRPLCKDGDLTEWSDRRIIPGTPFGPQILEKLKNSDVVVFLVSPDFLASEACIQEWNEAKAMSSETGQKLIPIIIRPCEWKKFDNMNKYLALPRDGVAISSWENEDEAWLGVSQGLRNLIETTKRSLEVKAEFKNRISGVEFVSKGDRGFGIDQLFVFPHLVLDGMTDRDNSEKRVSSLEELSCCGRALIRGEVLSGKTTLCRQLFLYVASKSEPVMLIDLEEVGRRKPSESFFREIHFGQMKGDYRLWKERSNKTLILDNLSLSTTSFLEYAKKYFKNIIVTTSDDKYIANLAIEPSISDFRQVRLIELSHSMQENLIRRWKSLGAGDISGQIEVIDSDVSKAEKNVNAILANRIVPRYPFFVLSILQSYEAFIPGDLTITAYGHCYQALIVAHLLESGVDKRDIDACFNYLGELAIALHMCARQQGNFEKKDYEEFRKKYERKFISLSPGILNRLFGQPTSVLALKNQQVRFSWPYSYFFFLGLYLSNNYHDYGDSIDDMVDKSYLKDNSLSLMFLIHHSNNSELIEGLLLHTMCTIDGRNPVSLNREEIRAFEKTLQKIPSDISTDKSVADVREEERNRRDELEANCPDGFEESPHDSVNDIYKALKNMEILGQIVKNKRYSIERNRLLETIEIVTDTALRLAGLFLLDSSELEELAKFCKERLEGNENGTAPSLEAIKEELGILVFVLIMSCIEKAVSAIDRREIKDVVEEVCAQKETPAYDLIHSFYLIDIADRLSSRHVEMARRMLRKHRKNALVSKALPIRLQMYMNSHRTNDSIRNAMKSQFRLLEDKRQKKGRSRR